VGGLGEEMVGYCEADSWGVVRGRLFVGETLLLVLCWMCVCGMCCLLCSIGDTELDVERLMRSTQGVEKLHVLRVNVL
jgi:hypothetical protein